MQATDDLSALQDVIKETNLKFMSTLNEMNDRLIEKQYVLSQDNQSIHRRLDVQAAEQVRLNAEITEAQRRLDKHDEVLLNHQQFLEKLDRIKANEEEFWKEVKRIDQHMREEDVR